MAFYIKHDRQSMQFKCKLSMEYGIGIGELSGSLAVKVSARYAKFLE